MSFIWEKLRSTEAVDTKLVKQIVAILCRLRNIVLNISFVTSSLKAVKQCCLEAYLLVENERFAIQLELLVISGLVLSFLLQILFEQLCLVHSDPEVP